jgi:predicted site-specific integrase-resolvase
LTELAHARFERAARRPKKHMLVSEVAEAMGISMIAVSRLCNAGKLKSLYQTYRGNTRRWVSEDSVKRYIRYHGVKVAVDFLSSR